MMNPLDMADCEWSISLHQTCRDVFCHGPDESVMHSGSEKGCLADSGWLSVFFFMCFVRNLWSTHSNELDIGVGRNTILILLCFLNSSLEIKHCDIPNSKWKQLLT